MEDDVRLLPGRDGVLRELVLPPDFDLIYLHEMRVPGLHATVIASDGALHRVRPAMLTTGAYVVSRRFAERFCARFARVEMPVDHSYQRASESADARFFELAEPMFSFQGHFSSTIDLASSPAGKPHVTYATIYPPNPEDRAETSVTRELLREHAAAERGFSLSVVIASAHPAALETAAKVLAEFPTVPATLPHLETEHAGVRAEEISFCKEQLPQRLLAENFDYLLFMDADVWTPIAQVPEWISIIGCEHAHRFVKVKYCLRSSLLSPSNTLGAYFHHKALLSRTAYWTRVFPRNEHGRRTGAPDCYLHDYLESQGCQKIVPERLTTFHFRDAEVAHVYRNGALFRISNARDEVVSGRAAQAARSLAS